MKIKTVTILGANGTMGSNVSGIFASFGNAKVYMVSRNMEDSFEAKTKAALSVRSEAIQRNLIPKGYEDLSECINESDLIFESVSEDFSVKEKIFQKIKGCLQTEPLIATGSSGLSIRKLSSLLPERLKSGFMGIHFYNPPYNLPACEVIPSEYTDDQVLEATKNYLSGVLFRKVIQVKDSPAFLGNRIGFFFINKAMIFAEKYKAEGGTDYIDAILGPFSGRSMPPLVTSNFVGLDVHKAIVDNVFLNSHDPAIKSFKFPAYGDELIASGCLGRKSGGGLYKTITLENGKKEIHVYDIKDMKYRKRRKYFFPFSEKIVSLLKEGRYSDAIHGMINSDSPEAKICLEFLLEYICYSIYYSVELTGDYHASDDVMATGFNWIPPLALIDAMGGKGLFLDVLNNVQEVDQDLKECFVQLWSNIPSSKFDYRPFLKALN